MKETFKDVADRAVKTFWQSGIAYVIATFSAQMGEVDVFDIQAVRGILAGILIGALAAGISASWNGVIQPVMNKLKGGGL